MLLLFTIPLLAFCLKNVSGEESGILSIGLYQEETEDDAVQEVIEALLQKESVIHFERVESEESGRERVQKRELDALWIFREDFQDKIEGILTGRRGRSSHSQRGAGGYGCFTVIQSEAVRRSVWECGISDLP